MDYFAMKWHIDREAKVDEKHWNVYFYFPCANICVRLCIMPLNRWPRVKALCRWLPYFQSTCSGLILLWDHVYDFLEVRGLDNTVFGVALDWKVFSNTMLSRKHLCCCFNYNYCVINLMWRPRFLCIMNGTNLVQGSYCSFF